MKIMATWTRRDRGLAIGLMVGALAVGSASPHLINALGGVGGPWRPVIYLAALSAVSAAIIAGLFIREGPYASATPRFDPRQVAVIASDRPLRLANVGYLGHMWELYAMWVWLPSFLLASFALHGLSGSSASMVAFAAIAVGGAGSVAAGLLADRFGRTTVTSVSLVISALCALGIGFLFGGSPAWLTIVALMWGLAIVADSAQYSAAITELAEGAYVGTALTLQTSLGFLLTLITIRLVPVVEAAVGWRYAFSFLAPGPAVGLWAMVMLRRSPAARKMAGGRG
jgi:MFS family permease